MGVRHVLTLATTLLTVALKVRAEGFRYLPPTSAGVPNPLAFFPLTDGTGNTVASWPSPLFVGTSNGSLSWKSDDVFGQVPSCERELQDNIIVDAISYGTSGAFSVNIWFKQQGNNTGDLFGYVFSHSAYGTSQRFSNRSTWDDNQVHIFVAQDLHPAAGLIRSVVKDSNDVQEQSFLDSDGTYRNNEVRAGPPAVSVLDGKWHMATLTASSSAKGFSLYLDGALVAQLPLPDNATTVFRNGMQQPVFLDGGDPMLLGKGGLFLCGRADGDASRYFSGSVSHLGVYNTTLSSKHIKALYDAVPLARKPSAAPAPATAPVATVQKAQPAAAPVAARAVAPATGPASSQLGVDSQACVFPTVVDGVSFNDCVYITVNFLPVPVSVCGKKDGGLNVCQSGYSPEASEMLAWLQTFQNSTLLTADSSAPADGMERLAGFCAYGVSGDNPAPCPTFHDCLPIHPSQLGNINTTRYPTSFKGHTLGVCATAAQRGIFYPAPQAGVPAPMAYFPLAGALDGAWPALDYTAQLNGSQWVADDTFGMVVQCQASQHSDVVVPAVPFSAAGPFAINVWLSQSKPAPGDTFQYLLSARNPAAGPIDTDSVFYANQIHLYLPEDDHPAHGLVRAIVKDSDDLYVGAEARRWLDSDGAISSNANRTGSYRGPDLKDGRWHMVTLTTRPASANSPTPKGYLLYVDGLLAAAMPQQPTQQVVAIDGGDALTGLPEIMLCSRSDDHPDRHFDGKVTQLSLFDSGLSESQVAALWTAVTGTAPVPVPAAAPQALAPLAAPAAAPSISTMDVPAQVTKPDQGGSGTSSASAENSNGQVPQARGGRSLSGGALAGIIAAVVVAVATGFVAALVLVVRRRRGAGGASSKAGRGTPGSGKGFQRFEDSAPAMGAANPAFGGSQLVLEPAPDSPVARKEPRGSALLTGHTPSVVVDMSADAAY